MNEMAISRLPIVWQGSVAPWECDQMGHMNTRFYIDRLEEAVASFSRVVGRERNMRMTPPFFGTRFLKEARAGTPMRMRVGISTRDATKHELFALLQDMQSGDALASYHCSLGTEILPPHIFRDYEIAVPPAFAPRSFSIDPPALAPPADPAGLGLTLIAAGAFMDDDCEQDGRIRLSQPFARLSDGMPQFMSLARETVAAHASQKPERVGGAMLEGRVDFHEPAMCGDRFELWGAITKIGGKAFTMESRMIDPANHHVFATMKNVSVVFDLDRRAAVPVSAEARKALEPIIRVSAS